MHRRPRGELALCRDEVRRLLGPGLAVTRGSRSAEPGARGPADLGARLDGRPCIEVTARAPLAGVSWRQASGPFQGAEFVFLIVVPRDGCGDSPGRFTARASGCWHGPTGWWGSWPAVAARLPGRVVSTRCGRVGCAGRRSAWLGACPGAGAGVTICPPEEQGAPPGEGITPAAGHNATVSAGPPPVGTSCASSSRDLADGLGVVAGRPAPQLGLGANDPGPARGAGPRIVVVVRAGCGGSGLARRRSRSLGWRRRTPRRGRPSCRSGTSGPRPPSGRDRVR